MAKAIDAHHHLWHYDPAQYGWIGPEMHTLQHDFLPHDLEVAAKAANVAGSVAVQARQTLEETRWLLSCAAETPFLQGVVGWLPLVDPQLPSILREFRDAKALKGVRHVIQDEPDDRYILSPDFNRGIDALLEADLAFDLLVQARHLPQTSEFVRRHPQQRFVLDHLAKPDIRSSRLQPWKDDLKRLADAGNVFCKCSGLATEAEWAAWTLEDLSPYLDAALEAFGPDHLMAGSDWPVCLLATEYSRWWDTLRQWSLRLTEPQQDQFLGATASTFYKL